MRRTLAARWRGPAAVLVVLLVVAIAARMWIHFRPPAGPALRLAPVAFSQLPGWQANDPARALAAFRRSCDELVRRAPSEPMGGAGYAGRAGDWQGVCIDAKSVTGGAAATRGWFEKKFAAFRLSGGTDDEGLFTGYYEPEIRGSRVERGAFATPVYGLPRDLITLDLAQFGRKLPDIRLVGRLSGQRLVPYPARAAIDSKGLSGTPVLLYADDPVSVFFLQIQGSGRALLEDGTMLRLAYAGQNGRPYTPIGRTLIEMGAIARQQMSMQAISAWLKSHPSAARAVMESDQSFVFFRELPIGDPTAGSPGSENVPLTPGASVAIDPSIHPFAVPMYVAATAPSADPRKPDQSFKRLVIAQDSGGAIKGALRVDVFWGFGADAESIAGRMKSEGALFVLLPKTIAARAPKRFLASR